ncbi:MAG TPA: GWxTD domain-containing protein [Gemmatimonadales bacterium]
MRTTTLVSFIVMVTARLAAQAPADRAALERLRDSLGGVTDSLALRRLEQATIARAKLDRDNPLLHLQLGFIAVRLGEIGSSKAHFDDAAGEFQWASELQPDWPYPWYGLGTAELAVGENSSLIVENIQQWLHKDYLSRAATAFAHAAMADPSFAQATVDLATTALAQRVGPRLDVALAAVRQAAASPAGAKPLLQLMRGRVEREAGDADSAIVGFQAYLALGGDSGVGYLELARSAYKGGRSADGARWYYAGARAARSDEARASYREDLSWVASPADLATFDTLANGEPRVLWLERFWDRRDAAHARDPGERLAEHYRRWYYVRQNFRLATRHRHYDITDVYRTTQREFDDRGLIYLRHGEPDRRAFFTKPGIEPNESWLYLRGDGDLVFHFVAREHDQDYKLVESLVDVFGFAGGVVGQTGTFGSVSELYSSRDQFGPLYARISQGTVAQGSALAEERRLGQRSIAIGTTTDSYRQPFDASLDLLTRDFVVGDGAGTGQALHVVFAVPAGRLSGHPVAGGVVYPLHFRLLVSDTSDRLVARVDTARLFRAHEPLGGDAYLTGQLAVAVPPGDYRYRLLVNTPDSAGGDVVLGDSITVERLDGSTVAASDLVLGRRGSGLVWTAAGDTVLLNPLARFPQGSAAELYYEVYGMERGAAMHTVVRLEREGGRSFFGAIKGLFGGRRAPVVLEFDAPADGPITRVHRGLDLRDAPRGRYLLSLTVTAGPRVITRTQRFQITAR